MFYLGWAAVLIGAYGIGSIPTGYLVAYCGGIKDIRNHGSGNIGATNVARILGAPYFIPVFIIDATKASLYLMAVRACGYHESMLLACACSLLVGNSYSLFLRFTGGKGFATATGIMCVLEPWLAFALFGVWTITLVLTRTVGIASVITCLGLVIAGLYCFPCHTCPSATFIAIGLWGVWRHADNIKRYWISCDTV